MKAAIAGGGTGGHLFPGIALAQALKKRMPESEILFIGTSRLIDQEALKNQGFTVATLTSTGLKGMGPLGVVKGALSQPRAVWQAMKLLRRFRPEIVFGVGGYVTGPALLAAKLLGIPTAIHEQNSVPGLANRLAGRFVDRICISLPCSPAFSPARTVRTGNPVRAAILEAAGRERRVLSPDEQPHLLVLGGSQGARAVNRLMVAAAALLREQGLRPAIKHQTGRAEADSVRADYEKAGVEAEVLPFIEDMAGAYAWADLALSRAGATSLAELAVMGLPAVLVPYPFAADDHQATNAAHYVQGEGALAFREADLTPETLADHLRTLLSDATRLARMGQAMRALALPDAAERLVDECLALTAVSQPSS